MPEDISPKNTKSESKLKTSFPLRTSIDRLRKLQKQLAKKK